MSDDSIKLPNGDGFWPAMEWSEAEWHGFLTPELAERVRGYAAARDVPFREAVTALLEGALDQRARRQAGGRKRWADVTPRARRAHAIRAAQASSRHPTSARGAGSHWIRQMAAPASASRCGYSSGWRTPRHERTRCCAPGTRGSHRLRVGVFVVFAGRYFTGLWRGPDDAI